MSIDTHCKADFITARHLASELLLKQSLDSLFIDVSSFNFDIPVIIDSVQNFSSIVEKPLENFTSNYFDDVFVLNDSKTNRNFILYNEKVTNLARRNWGIAHELGHLYLEHETDGRIQEQEANVFASQLIVPEIALYYIALYKGSITTHDLTNYFNISNECAKYRLKSFFKRFEYIDKDDINNIYLYEKLMPFIEDLFLNNKKYS